VVNRCLANVARKHADVTIVTNVQLGCTHDVVMVTTQKESEGDVLANDILA